MSKEDQVLEAPEVSIEQAKESLRPIVEQVIQERQTDIIEFFRSLSAREKVLINLYENIVGAFSSVSWGEKIQDRLSEAVKVEDLPAGVSDGWIEGVLAMVDLVYAA